MCENIHYLRQSHRKGTSLVEFAGGLFWDCIPILIKNVIGLLTSNDNDFQNFKNKFRYCSLFKEDMYKSSKNCLKVASIAYDIINARYDSFSSPKHLLLGNELFHHVRSSHLLNVMNKFGHTCSYETMVSEAKCLRYLTSTNLIYISNCFTLDSSTKKVADSVS